MKDLTALLLTFLFVFPVVLLAQEMPVAPDLLAPVTGEELNALLQSIPEASGLLAIGLLVAQALILVIRFTGVFKKLNRLSGMVVAAVVHLVVGVLTLKVQGYAWEVIVLHSGFLAAAGHYIFSIAQNLLSEKGKA